MERDNKPLEDKYPDVAAVLEFIGKNINETSDAAKSYSRPPDERERQAFLRAKALQIIELPEQLEKLKDKIHIPEHAMAVAKIYAKAAQDALDTNELDVIDNMLLITSNEHLDIRCNYLEYLASKYSEL